MSSKADYLARYLSGEKPEKAKKKKKSQSASYKAPQDAPQIIIEGQQADSSSPAATQKDILSFHDSILQDDEFSPSSVENKDAVKVFKGFKRIDNGKTTTTNNPQQSTDETLARSSETNNATVYRDSAGRIVDLKAKRAEMERRKLAEAKEKEHVNTQVNTGDVDRIRQEKETEKIKQAKRFDYSKDDSEYIQYMKQKTQFDDPLAGFSAPASAVSGSPLSEAGRPAYQGNSETANRFKIPAGYFWDGINRSNGFEERLMAARNDNYLKKVTQKATQESYTEYDFD